MASYMTLKIDLVVICIHCKGITANEVEGTYHNDVVDIHCGERHYLFDCDDRVSTTQHCEAL